jgi:hypothetical protein
MSIGKVRGFKLVALISTIIVSICWSGHSVFAITQTPDNQNDQTADKQEKPKKPDEHAGHDMSKMGDEGMTSMNSLMVMMGDEMGIRLGAKKTNAIPMAQMGSGTSWLPRSTPMYMYHRETNGWLLMFHFDVKAGANVQGGARGVAKFESSNWFMPMAFHRLGPGTIQFRGMLSFEPFTFARGGTPLLFQTGETFNGQPLIDRQHPHDLFMELSTTYTVPIGERASWFAYVGYPGEPALGPVAFMHRASAMETPAAPLAHHLEDSTHISFGVFTTGMTYRGFKAEGSIFNGREPDENRYNFEAHKWDSRSIRLSYAPNQNWSVQWSYGLLRKPEALEPTDQHRMTASVSYNKPFNRGNWASSLIWGRNHIFNSGPPANLNGYTAESTVNFLDKNYLFTRIELVDKNELLRPEDLPILGITDLHKTFRIGAYTFGGTRDLVNSKKLSFAIGGDITFYSMPSMLNKLYGDNPVSFQVFFRLRPRKMEMHDSHGMSGH